jgi:hypothetical protein
MFPQTLILILKKKIHKGTENLQPYFVHIQNDGRKKQLGITTTHPGP